jgi:membrane protein implicated in regulation of membrane protease activity
VSKAEFVLADKAPAAVQWLVSAAIFAVLALLVRFLVNRARERRDIQRTEERAFIEERVPPELRRRPLVGRGFIVAAYAAGIGGLLAAGLLSNDFWVVLLGMVAGMGPFVAVAWQRYRRELDRVAEEVRRRAVHMDNHELSRLIEGLERSYGPQERLRTITAGRQPR